jgi:hypothetical protein
MPIECRTICKLLRMSYEFIKNCSPMLTMYIARRINPVLNPISFLNNKPTASNVTPVANIIWCDKISVRSMTAPNPL